MRESRENRAGMRDQPPPPLLPDPPISVNEIANRLDLSRLFREKCSRYR